MRIKKQILKSPRRHRQSLVETEEFAEKTHHSPKPSVRDAERLEESSLFPAAAEAKLEGRVEGMSTQRVVALVLCNERIKCCRDACVQSSAPNGGYARCRWCTGWWQSTERERNNEYVESSLE